MGGIGCLLGGIFVSGFGLSREGVGGECLRSREDFILAVLV